MTDDVYSALAVVILALHLLFILWIVFGAPGHTTSSPIALAAHWLAVLGHPDRNPTLDLPVDMGGKLVGNSGGDGPVPGRIPTALSRRSGLS